MMQIDGLMIILCVKATYKNCRKDFTAPCNFIQELLRLVLVCTYTHTCTGCTIGKYMLVYLPTEYSREIYFRGLIRD